MLNVDPDLYLSSLCMILFSSPQSLDNIQSVGFSCSKSIMRLGLRGLDICQIQQKKIGLLL